MVKITKLRDASARACPCRGFGTRHVRVACYPWIVGLRSKDGEATWFPLEGLPGSRADVRADRVWFEVLAVDGEHLASWRPGFELTEMTVRLLWGPGAWDDLPGLVERSASAWH